LVLAAQRGKKIENKERSNDKCSYHHASVIAARTPDVCETVVTKFSLGVRTGKNDAAVKCNARKAGPEISTSSERLKVHAET
jgi:hypothetical protein